MSCCRAVVDDIGDQALQSSLYSEALMSSVGLTLSFHDSLELSRYFSFWHPLPGASIPPRSLEQVPPNSRWGTAGAENESP